jgi:hypothetical protein
LHLKDAFEAFEASQVLISRDPRGGGLLHFQGGARSSTQPDTVRDN